MNNSALAENAMMLGQVLGIDHREAANLLDETVVITIGNETSSLSLQTNVQRLLAKTIKRVATDVETDAALEIIIGNASARTSALQLFVSIEATKVIIGGDTFKSCEEPCHPVLLTLAAPFVAAAAMRKIFDERLPYPASTPIIVDLTTLWGADLKLLFNKVNIGECYLAGAGAIGSHFIRSLGNFDLSGKVYISDDDSVSAGNLNRCDFFDEADIGSSKALVLAKKAKSIFKDLELIPRSKRLKECAVEMTDGKIQRLIVAVDSRRARRALQLDLPGEVYDASTTGISEVVVHFNKLASAFACLSCIYKQETMEQAHEKHIADALGVPLSSVIRERVSLEDAVLIQKRYPQLQSEHLVGQAYDTLFKQLCGEGKVVDRENEQILAPFAFVSALAGALLALEFFRRIQSTTPDEPFNYWRVSPWSSPQMRLRAKRPVATACEFHGNEVYVRVARKLLLTS